MLRKCSKQVYNRLFTDNTTSIVFKNCRQQKKYDKGRLLLDSVVSVQQPFQNNDKSWQQYTANLLFHLALTVYFQHLRHWSQGTPPPPPQKIC